MAHRNANTSKIGSLVTTKMVTEKILAEIMKPGGNRLTDKDLAERTGFPVKVVQDAMQRIHRNSKRDVANKIEAFRTNEFDSLYKLMAETRNMAMNMLEDANRFRLNDSLSKEYLQFMKVLPSVLNSIDSVSKSIAKLIGVNDPDRVDKRIKDDVMDSYRNHMDKISNILCKYVDSETLEVIIKEMEDTERDMSNEINKIVGNDIVDAEFEVRD